MFITNNLKVSALAAIGIGSVSCLLLPLSANAATMNFTDENTFLNATSPTNRYLENFDSLGEGGIASPSVFTGTGFSYSVTAGSGDLFSSTGNTGSRFLGTSLANQPITITFSGSVTAVGGEFFIVDFDSNLAAGAVNLTLNDGSIVDLTSPTAVPKPFGGFTTDGALITSLTFAAPIVPDNFAAFDKFYVGTSIAAVPFEFSPTFGLSALGGLWLGNRLIKKVKANKKDKTSV